MGLVSLLQMLVPLIQKSWINERWILGMPLSPSWKAGPKASPGGVNLCSRLDLCLLHLQWLETARVRHHSQSNSE